MASFVGIPLTIELAERVIRNLSERDRAELLAVVPRNLGKTENEDLMAWAQAKVDATATVNANAWAIICEESGAPVAMGGVSSDVFGTPWLAYTWCVGTPERTEVVQAGVAVFRQAKVMHRIWTERGVRKFSCMCLDRPGGPPSEWLEKLGYSLEGVLHGHGRHGETFKLWGKTNGG